AEPADEAASPPAATAAAGEEATDPDEEIHTEADAAVAASLPPAATDTTDTTDTTDARESNEAGDPMDPIGPIDSLDVADDTEVTDAIEYPASFGSDAGLEGAGGTTASPAAGAAAPVIDPTPVREVVESTADWVTRQVGAVRRFLFPLGVTADQALFYAAVVMGLIGLYCARRHNRQILEQPDGDDRLQHLSAAVGKGAMAYLRAQCGTVLVVFLVVFAAMVYLAREGLLVPLMPLAFLTGGLLSGICARRAAAVANRAGPRTCQAAAESLGAAFSLAFRAGAVIGLGVVAIAVLGIAAWYWALDFLFYTADHMADGWLVRCEYFDYWLIQPGTRAEWKYWEISQVLIAFGLGSTLRSLFARIGGGTYTKVADMGADLVGKVEEGLPEGDSRNPASLADSIGDTVGDVAGMAADMHESGSAAVLATVAVGAALLRSGGGGPVTGAALVLAPMIVAGLGVVIAAIGISRLRPVEDGAGRAVLFAAINRPVRVAAFLNVLAAVVLVFLDILAAGTAAAMITGLVAGIWIAKSIRHQTSDEYGPTRAIAEECSAGAGNCVVAGLGSGMFSSCKPVCITAGALLLAYGFAGGFAADSSLGIAFSPAAARGLYGIGFAAIGMLATLGVTLAADAYGPVADIAGGAAAMLGITGPARERTDQLDIIGNTTAAIGKGYAAASAALTTVLLMALGHGLLPPAPAPAGGDASVLNPRLLAGLLLGSMLVFTLAAVIIRAIGRGSARMAMEIRRQFDGNPDLLPDARPDYARCIAIATRSAQRHMILPSLAALVAPVAVGVLLGQSGVLGLVTGALATGVVMAFILNNAGGAWDNAKKLIERLPASLGEDGEPVAGIGSPRHRAAVITGDIVGDPFKDAAGPSLNIIVKLLAMVSVVFMGVTVEYGEYLIPTIQRVIRDFLAGW
ncbi:MAG: sodium-translocating pyrophosphatase, partial [Planctomycetes bacterium]|nr:sodium-translocating pyrophosphatase [Planctomycetota bacterium]